MNMQARVQTEVLKEAATTGVLDVAEVCSHVPRADSRDVARAVELLADGCPRPSFVALFMAARW